MNILVTGASGFLGRHLCKTLNKRGDQLVELNSKNCNLTYPDSLKQFNGQTFDQIFHLAAWTQAGDFCLRHPGEQWLINQKINTHLLSWWHTNQPQAKLICMGTSCGYAPNLELREENYLAGQPIDSLFTYAMTKRMMLTGLIALNKQFGLNYLYCIPSTLYGPGYHTDERQLHFIFDLIRKILRGAYYGEKVELWGDGAQKRELVHIDDFVTTLLAINETTQNRWLNIGAGKEYSIKTFAKEICEIVGYPSEKIHFDRSKYVGARSKVLCIDDLRKIYPKFKPRSLQEGLRATVDWFESEFFPEGQKRVRNASTHRCETIPD